MRPRPMTAENPVSAPAAVPVAASFNEAAADDRGKQKLILEDPEGGHVLQ